MFTGQVLIKKGRKLLYIICFYIKNAEFNVDLHQLPFPHIQTVSQNKRCGFNGALKCTHWNMPFLRSQHIISMKHNSAEYLEQII